ncbi:MAG: BON domain-containing protein [Acidobacteriota bacterium]|nr:BON domain-containing protein [Acidobacteriota bacterium]
MKTRTTYLGAATLAALCCIAIPMYADSNAVVDLTSQLRNDVRIDGLSAVEVGGIVVLRGRTGDASLAERAGVLAQKLGYARVANLIRVVAPPDDAAIQRMAERKLATDRALDGCRFHVDSNGGVVTVAGKVNQELQKDVAVDVLRQIEGVRSVHSDLLMNRSN